MLFMLPVTLLQAQNTYTMHIRVQFADSTDNCHCMAAVDNVTGFSSGTCNPLSGVMIAVYHDTDLTATYYTDETGFSPHFKLKETNYRLLLYTRNYDSLSVMINFKADNIDRRILYPANTDLSYASTGNKYFLCVVLSPNQNNKGVHIVPYKGIKK